MKVNNALVTWTDLSTMNLPAKGIPETGNRIATKQFIIDNYVVDQTVSPFSTYTALRCPPYQTILPGIICGMTGTATYNNLPTPAPLAGVPTSAVAISRDTGQYQLIGAGLFTSTTGAGYLYTSNDYGATWYRSTSLLGYWQSVSVSGNGQYMLAVQYYGNAFRSSDYGITWTQITNFPYPAGTTNMQILNFRGTAISSSGQYQAITTKEIRYSDNRYYAYTFVSNDYGVSWSVGQLFENSDIAVNCVSMDSTGQFMYTGTANTVIAAGNVYRSSNYGSSWSGVATNSAGGYADISISADGAQGVAAVYSNSNYTYSQRSVNNGLTWTNVTTSDNINGASPNDAWYRCVISKFSSTTYIPYLLVNYTNYIKFIPFTGMRNLTAATNSYTWRDISTDNSGTYFLAASTTGTARSSNSGINWYILT